jgi:glycosyltransferase involved in cell wall biosynthesis
MKITVALLTRNRPEYLRQAMTSILAQREVELDLLVLDNASTDDTASVVASFHDPRITYLRNEHDLGIVGNWNRGIELAVRRSPYTCVFHDDDLMLDGFLAESVRALQEHPSAGMSLCLCQFIREDGSITGQLDPCAMPEGLVCGLDFLELAIGGRALAIPPPIVVFRSDILSRVAPADSPHTRLSLDMNLYYRTAASSDVVMLKKLLTQYRMHEGSDTELINRTARSSGWYGTMAERIDAIASLLRSPRANDPEYRHRMVERLLTAHAHQSTAIHTCIPELYHPWEVRRTMLLKQLENSLPAGEPFILIDDGQLGLSDGFNGRRAIPFIERDGQYWGAPAHAAEAISELKRMREARVAQHIVVAWPSYWWLDQYGEFDRYLRRECRLVMESPHALVFDLTSA